MSDLIFTLINKLVTAMLEMSEQLHHVRNSNSEAEDLIQMLSLQAITQLKIRLTADNFMLFKETFNLSQKTVLLNTFIKFIIYNNFNISEKKSSIFNLIKNIQEFDLLYK